MTFDDVPRHGGKFLLKLHLLRALLKNVISAAPVPITDQKKN